MVWAGFSAQGKTKIAFLTGRQNSEDYIYTVSEFLLPYAHLHYGTEFIYQQDGASIHTSKASLEFLQEQGVQVLEWTPRSPDLNPIENLWSILTRRVYQNGRQFNSVAEQRVAIEAA
ncbi:Transposase [Phytophthora palmivora]|uniref:Transposase n=1 Tax=Phytophthora palmivora TaxID=4796 RepID=A0A2P4YAY1_9STRA|nr:Transposase [Phytophthora palmivora]